LIFDASAVYALVRYGHPELLAEGITLDLVYYELGSALWKEVRRRKAVTEKEALQLWTILQQVLEAVEIRTLQDLDLSAVLQTALRTKLPFCDAAYLVLAATRDEILVSENEELRKAAERLGVRALSVVDLLRIKQAASG